jgi:hypothetical protein
LKEQTSLNYGNTALCVSKMALCFVGINPRQCRIYTPVNSINDHRFVCINLKAMHMERITIEKDLNVMGFQVHDFPNGIGKAFDSLVARVPGGFNRPYYGISQMTDKGMVYLATALEKEKGEAEQCNYERYEVKKGEYLAVPLKDWRKKTETIKDIFQQLFQSPLTDKKHPCVEWYKNDNEMLCMMKVAEEK